MPVVWVIDAYRAGERGQVRALADALGWDCEIRQLSYRKQVFLPHLLRRDSVRGLTAASRSSLSAPWPDLVISSGVRNEPVCRWIRAQSGGHTRYVHVGRPWAALESFDLLITTPQYRVARRDNVVNNTLTLHGVDQQRLADAAAQWQPQFAHLPRPITGVMVGGNSGPFTLGPRAARRLGQAVSQRVRDNGGSVLVTTSSRTPEPAVDALAAAVDVPSHVYRWRAGDEANPYLGILACADELVITADSIAMLSEASATGKPVYMFDLGGMRADHPVSRDFRLGASLYGLLMRYLPPVLSRDITLVHERLLDSGCAAWLGDEYRGERHAATDDMARAVAAVKALFGETGVTVGVEEPGATAG